jgi:hypothetical protein
MRLSLVATAVVAAACALAGCTNGGNSGTSSTPTSGAASPEAVAYMDKVCGAASEFAKIEKTAPKLDADSAKLKAEMAAYMGQLADAFTKSAEGLKNVGPSPVAGGEEAVNKMAETFTSLGVVFTDAKTKVEQADANNATGGIQAAGEAIAKLSELADPLRDLKNNPELQKATQTAPKCQEMQRLNVAPTS